jgi:hypothetical protein
MEYLMIKFKQHNNDNFNIIYIDDDIKYLQLFDDFLAGRIEGQLIGSFPERKTWRISAWGRNFVIKRICVISGKPKRHLWEILSGHHFSRLLRETWEAIERGCNFIPKIYLAAEKFSGWHRCVDSYLIAEYVEGEVLQLGQRPEPDSEWLQTLGPLVAKLHCYGLAHGAPHPWNLIKTEKGFQFIDLSFKGPMIVCQAHDVLDAWRKWGVNVPINTVKLRIVFKLTFLKYKWHVFRRTMKQKIKQIFNKS